MKNYQKTLPLIALSLFALQGRATMIPMSSEQQARICAVYPQTYFCNNEMKEQLKDKFVMGVDPKINDGRYDNLTDEELKAKGCSRATLNNGKVSILCTGLIVDQPESQNDILKRNLQRAMSMQQRGMYNPYAYNPYFYQPYQYQAYQHNPYANPYFSSIYDAPRTMNPNMLYGQGLQMQTLPYQVGATAQAY